MHGYDIHERLHKLWNSIRTPWIGVQNPWVGPILTHLKFSLYCTILGVQTTCIVIMLKVYCCNVLNLRNSQPIK